MQASRAFDLPCPWVPLQSMTAAASRRTPGRPGPAVSCGGKGSARFWSSRPGPAAPDARRRLVRVPSAEASGIRGPHGLGAHRTADAVSVCFRGRGRLSSGCRSSRARGVGQSLTTTSQGSVPFGVSTRAIVMPDCLSGTFRSQGFSPSQRFHPARASWLCFTPHPPLGFWSSEPCPLGQP